MIPSWKIKAITDIASLGNSSDVDPAIYGDILDAIQIILWLPSEYPITYVREDDGDSDTTYTGIRIVWRWKDKINVAVVAMVVMGGIVKVTPVFNVFSEQLQRPEHRPYSFSMESFRVYRRDDGRTSIMPVHSPIIDQVWELWETYFKQSEGATKQELRYV